MKFTNNERQIIIEDAKLIYRHFSGERDDYHAQDDRDFCVELDSEMENFDLLLETMRAEGWNIKSKEMADGSTKYWINKVKVSFKIRPPEIYIVTVDGEGKRNLKPIEESALKMLDYADIATADMIIDKHRYTLPGRGDACNGYVRKLYITLVEDPLANKYAGI